MRLNASWSGLVLLVALLSPSLCAIAQTESASSQPAATQPQTHPQSQPHAATQPQTQPERAPLTFTLTYDPAICDSFTGRVYVMTAAGGSQREPRFGPSWFNTEPFFALDVVDWEPDAPLTFDNQAIGFPGKLSEVTVPEHGILVQAVMRRNLDSPHIGTSAGTAFSKAIEIKPDSLASPIAVHISHVAPKEEFAETARIKLVELRSNLLSDFHNRDIIMRAAVILPRNYESEKESTRRYPALYWIGGFGGDHRAARFKARSWERTGLDDRFIRVVLDPLCYGGHHTFADSANNGPRGRALVEEFIPHLEQQFRLVAAPTARFLSGHSSGGWSSLWLQVTYPDFFGGTWSVAPDPVDFRDFQRINLYEPGVNMYIDEAGNRRPLARSGEQVLAWYEPFAKMEVVHGEGGQLRSFEWVFSPRGSDDLPRPLYDRNSGMVNADVADAWRRYDIRLILENNWPTLGPQLSNGAEIRIFMGGLDTFYLDGATQLLKQSQAKLKSDAIIEIEPRQDHGSIDTPRLRQRMDREMIEIFNKHHPEYALPLAYD